MICFHSVPHHSLHCLSTPFPYPLQAPLTSAQRVLVVSALLSRSYATLIRAISDKFTLLLVWFTYPQICDHVYATFSFTCTRPTSLILSLCLAPTSSFPPFSPPPIAPFPPFPPVEHCDCRHLSVSSQHGSYETDMCTVWEGWDEKKGTRGWE